MGGRKKGKRKVLKADDNANISNKPAKNKPKLFQILVLVLVILAIIIFSIGPDLKGPPKKSQQDIVEPVFIKEGTLTLFRSADSAQIKQIDIEIAETNKERAQGLMYRTQMAESQGMFFIMRREETQSFWMRNTYIPLDIIYLDNDLRIVTIQKYTEPLSDEPVPSYKNAKYVLEVIAGFTNKYAIIEGDFVQYER